MNELDYIELQSEIEKKLQTEEMIVLATCADNKVTARMMCHINDGLTIMFSTSKNSQKVEQIRQNPNIALSIGNLKIEAVAELFGPSLRSQIYSLSYIIFSRYFLFRVCNTDMPLYSHT